MQVWFTCSSSITSSTNREDEWYDVAAQILGRENHGLRELFAHSHGKILRMYFEHAKSGKFQLRCFPVQPHVVVHRQPTPALIFERIVQFYITICNYSGHKRGLWFCHCCKSPPFGPSWPWIPSFAMTAILPFFELKCGHGTKLLNQTPIWLWITPHTKSWL
jgi:hypothetical protein